MNELFNLSACCAFNPFFKHTTYQCDIKETIVTAITSNILTIFKIRLPCCIVCNTQGSEITKYANKAKQTFILRGQNVVYNVPTLNWIIFKYIIFDGPETNFFYVLQIEMRFWMHFEILLGHHRALYQSKKEGHKFIYSYTTESKLKILGQQLLCFTVF